MSYEIEKRFEFRRIDQYETQGKVINRLKGRYLDIACVFETPLSICAMGTRLSHESQHLSDDGRARDIALMQRMIASGDEHAKGMRFKRYTLLIEAPRYWWAEMDTYTVGVLPLGSTSTMHKECKKLKGDDLVKAKSELSEGTLQLRLREFSWHALQRILKQRREHRLPEWQEFAAWCDLYTNLSESENIAK